MLRIEGAELRWVVGDEDIAASGLRVDTAVASRLGCSVNQARRRIALGAVTVNGERRRKGDALQEGDVVVVDEAAGRLVADASVPVAVVQESDRWVVLDKPAGVPVLPGPSGRGGSLLNGLAARGDGVDWAGLASADAAAAHRLDTATSGCVLFAKDADTHAAIRDDWRPVRKQYEAVVSGHAVREGEVVQWLMVRRHKPARVAVAGPGVAEGWECRQTHEVLGEVESGTRVRVTLGTGFLHQVRVVCAHLGHPIVGDTVYGGAPAERLMLHACELRADAFGIDARSGAPWG